MGKKGKSYKMFQNKLTSSKLDRKGGGDIFLITFL